MKKVLTKLILATACTAALATCLAGCGDSLGDVDPLRFDSKYYIVTSVPTEKSGYYTFNANGTGKYYYYYSYSSDYVENYTISFKFTYANTGKTRVACFYDGVTYTDKDNKKSVSTSWSRVLDVSENVLTRQGQYGYYVEAVNEEYLKQLHHFG